MLIRFIISNFSSIDKEVQFNLLTSPERNFPHHVYKAEKVNILKAAAIFGANGAGKSTLIDAFRHLQQWVKSGSIPNAVNKLKFRINKKNEHLPIFFEIEFYTAGMFFVYGIQVDEKLIIKEYLCESGLKKLDKLIFKRSMDEMQNIDIEFADKEIQLSGLLKNDELLISHASIETPQIKAARNWLSNNMIMISPTTGHKELLLKLCTSDEFLSYSNQLIGTLDICISHIAVEKFDYDDLLARDEYLLFPMYEIEEHKIVPTNDGKYFTTKENGKIIFNKIIVFHPSIWNDPIGFDLAEESEGIQRLLEFFPVFFHIHDRDTTIIIDEINQSINPALLKPVIEKFMGDRKTTGQLIFTTHDSTLLDLKLLREDEIWFAERDSKTGATNCYPLSDFHYPDDLNIQTGYLKGRFGAVLDLAKFKHLKW
ncbi:AAA family ATPase [Chitinophaga sancti]|uniref:AAA domain-containing protein, putative AbiEii toxin, Type IV TA system n=1 Tax=Chitinophaga sancti TaxID=1004 RepID=A0A1K1S6S3_9BACT|nr:ATP-binding protein [Chitinophaga sancti]WQD62181.1 ATP-binding protein [Chitinophaga sancti]WQG92250.1 ATP-binding protein [Chitinophaga sancti]SFW80057.1 AAA domain-containing protein, putative AbiEii toxin, Type IV TA system [Chitinophaga sancti]